MEKNMQTGGRPNETEGSPHEHHSTGTHGPREWWDQSPFLGQRVGRGKERECSGFVTSSKNAEVPKFVGWWHPREKGIAITPNPSLNTS